MEERKVVLVEWDDAHACLDVESYDTLEESKPEKTYSVGWLVVKNKHGVVISMDVYESEDDKMGTTAFIPWGMITNVIPLGPAPDVSLGLPH